MSTDTQTSAADRWHAKVAKYVGGGLSKAAAASKVAELYPRLRDEYVAEANEQAEARKRQAKTAQPTGAATAKWRQVIAGYVDRGLSKVDATRFAVHEHADLYEQYITEYTERAREKARR